MLTFFDPCERIDNKRTFQKKEGEDKSCLAEIGIGCRGI